MKRMLILVVLSVMAVPVLAQESNQFHRRPGDRPDRELREHRELSPEQKAEMQGRRLQLMEKSLKEIGITEEQQAQISDLQENHRENILAISIKIGDARKKLSNLEQKGAPQEEIFKAIDELSDAQAEQLKIMSRNRMQMEQILGKEKYQRFMETARIQFRQHGRRGGSGLPPRPGLPPLPHEGGEPPKPPTEPRLPPPNIPDA
jgi:uncharacterized coiled-coil protein SlyX